MRNFHDTILLLGIISEPRVDLKIHISFVHLLIFIKFILYFWETICANWELLLLRAALIITDYLLFISFVDESIPQYEDSTNLLVEQIFALQDGHSLSHGDDSFINMVKHCRYHRNIAACIQGNIFWFALLIAESGYPTDKIAVRAIIFQKITLASKKWCCVMIWQVINACTSSMILIQWPVSSPCYLVFGVPAYKFIPYSVVPANINGFRHWYQFC